VNKYPLLVRGGGPLKGFLERYPFSCHQELIFRAEKLVVPEKIKYLNVNTKYKQLS
jgi:hypothetical protein